MLYDFELIGVTPLLVHADDLEAADRLSEWRKDPANGNISKAGDDRSPPWTWQTYLYTDGNVLTVPSDNIMVALRHAGAAMKMPGGRSGLTYKSITQSGLLFVDEHIPLLVGGKTISAKAIQEMDGTFAEQRQQVVDLGFQLYVKRAKISSSKHVRVRPRFEEWALRGRIEVLAEQEITGTVLGELFAIAGNSKGLCDWRPSSPKSPGPFGRFAVTLKKAK